MAPPASWGAVPGAAISAQVSSTTAPPQSSAITAMIAPPWRLSPTMMPKAQAIENGMTRSRKTSNRSVNGFGFSNGWAELAL